MSTSNQSPNSNKRKFVTSDVILIALAIYIVIRTPWNNLQPHNLILFLLLVIGFIMRATNKQMPKKVKAAKARAQKAQEEAAAKALLASKNETIEGSTTEMADVVPSEDIIEAVPSEEIAEEPSAKEATPSEPIVSDADTPVEDTDKI